MDRELQHEIESLVMEYAGPMGQFVVRKKINSLPKPFDKLDETELKVLIRGIVSAAVYNAQYKSDCTKRLSKKLLGVTMAV